MQKRTYPKTVIRKKILKGAFWTGFVLALFLSVIAIIRVGNMNMNEALAQQVEPEEKDANYAQSEGAQSFAQNFASDYFDWQNSDDGKVKRIERLKSYLATGLDEQAGLAFEGIEWNSSLSKSQVWNVEETGEDAALITLRIQHVLNKTIQSEPDAAPQEEKAGPYTKYFVVPVKTDGKSFVVHNIPYFIAAEEKPNITSSTSTSEKGKLQDTKLQEEITSALHTFFKIYTSGTKEELSYYLKDEEIQPMTGVLTFQDVKNLVMKQGKSKHEYKVNVRVMFQENDSKAQLIYPYQLMMIKEGNRWFVKSIKNS